MDENDDRPVLIVDDDDGVADVLAAVLSTFAISSHRATSLATAAETLARASYSLVLIDHNLGDGNGLDLMRDLHRDGKGTPFALMTGSRNYELALAALRLGATGFLEKPFKDIFSVGEAIQRWRRNESTVTPEYLLVGLARPSDRRCVETATAGEFKLSFVDDALALAEEISARRDTRLAVLWDAALGSHSILGDSKEFGAVSRIACGNPPDFDTAVLWINRGFRFLTLPLERERLLKVLRGSVRTA